MYFAEGQPTFRRLYVPTKPPSTFTGLHGVTSQKRELLKLRKFLLPLNSESFMCHVSYRGI
jgi:hypothetical protein